MPARDPALVLTAHGTADPAGQRVFAELATRVRERLPAVDVHLAFVDVQQPLVGEVVQRTARGAPVVVVPLLLAGGYHVEVDIADAVRSVPIAVAAPPLGPDHRLVTALLDRLAETGCATDDPVVLAVAGSSRPQARQDAQQMLALLAGRRSGPTTIGYAAGAAARVGDAVRAARRAGGGRPVTVAAYLLAPGHFLDRLHDAGADRVTTPLGTHPVLTDLAELRYRDAAARLRPGAGPARDM